MSDLGFTLHVKSGKLLSFTAQFGCNQIKRQINLVVTKF